MTEVAKKKCDVEMYSYGVYDRWDPKSKELPKVTRHTTDIPAKVGIEFGYVLKIRGARGRTLSFTIDHPPFLDSKGKSAAPFTGEQFIRDNDFQFFIGDSIWEPIDDKVGEWLITCEIDGNKVAEKAFNVVGTETT